MDQDHARGALLGTALGDALGAPFEGHPTVAHDRVEAWLASHDELTWTDDTAMMLGLARSLVARDGAIDPQHLGDTFAAAYDAEPWRGYGAGPPRIFDRASKGTPYREAAAALFDGAGSFGNGAAMRAAPVGVVGAPDPGHVARLAREQATVTHAHPLGQDGAALLAMAVAVVGGGDAREQLADLGRHLRTEELRAALARAVDLAGEDDAGLIARGLGNGIEAVTSVPAAVAAFLASPDEPVRVLRRAVTIGGDTDTIAAMAGAIAGARCGAVRLPAELLDRLEARDTIVAVADELAALRGP